MPTVSGDASSSGPDGGDSTSTGTDCDPGDLLDEPATVEFEFEFRNNRDTEVWILDWSCTPSPFAVEGPDGEPIAMGGTCNVEFFGVERANRMRVEYLNRARRN
jgi:hypothetical protein